MSDSSFEFGEDSDDEKDIVAEAKEDYSEQKQAHRELLDSLVEEHGSPYVEVEVDLGVGEPIPFAGRAGGSLIELIGRVGRLLNDPRMQTDRGPQVSEEEIMQTMSELTGGIDGVVDALGELCEDEDMDKEWFRDLYRQDMVAFLTVAQEVHTAIQEKQQEQQKSFPA